MRKIAMILLLTTSTSPALAGSFCLVDRHGREDCTDYTERARRRNEAAALEELADAQRNQPRWFSTRCRGSVCTTTPID